MSGLKKQSVKIGYSSFVDDLDEEYESCSEDVEVKAATTSSSSVTTTTLPSSPTITARVVAMGDANSPVQRASPVVTGARVITPGRPNARVLASSAPVNVISARVVAPAPGLTVGQPTFQTMPRAPVVVATRIVSRP